MIFAIFILNSLFAARGDERQINLKQNTEEQNDLFKHIKKTLFAFNINYCCFRCGF